MEPLDASTKQLSPQNEPLLNTRENNDTVTSMDSSLSTFENTSDIELGKIYVKNV